ncbi:MAG: hypothetical protein OHK003_18000 [Anaerolineales bacterium]
MAKKKKEETKAEFSPEEVKHLEFIQGVINRMGSNSFQMKGWMITIVSALLALYSGSSNKSFLLFAILPTLLFWYLDSYYLQQERKFRGLYNDVAKVSDTPKEIKPFAMPLNLYTGGKYSLWDVFTSETVLPLYAFVIVALLVVSFFL